MLKRRRRLILISDREKYMKHVRRCEMKTIHAALAIGFAIAWCAAPLKAIDDIYCDNVVVVFDASGSMDEPFSYPYRSKMDAAKAAIKQVLKNVPQSTHIGVLVFSAKNFREDWLYPLGPRNDAKMSDAIDRLQPGYMTPLGRYMKLGADALLQQRQKQLGYGTYRLLIVTDGEADDQPLVDRYTPEINARNICIDCIGVKMRNDHPLATKVHAYRRADDSAALSQAIGETFAEISAQGSDAAKASDFAMLSALPSEMALPMLKALSSTNDAPIGEKAVSGPRPPPTQISSPVETAPARVAASHEDGTEAATFILAGLCFVVLIIVIKTARSWTGR
jgi:hypothetical protein